MARSAKDDAELTALFKAAQAGDTVSYHRFLQRLTPLLRGVAGRKLAATGEVEDVVQEILISLHKARHTYDGERPLMPWVMAIAQFRITDHLRKLYSQARQPAVDIDAMAEILPDVTLTPPDNESVDEMLHNVAERERKILTMMHVEGYTAKETGAQLGMKESAVKVAAHRAMKKIREKMGT